MNKFDIKNSFKKVMLTFETQRSHINFVRFFIMGCISLACVLTAYIYNSSVWVLSFLIVPVTVLWSAFDYFRKSRSAYYNLREMHNGEINDELKRFSAKGFKKTL